MRPWTKADGPAHEVCLVPDGEYGLKMMKPGVSIAALSRDATRLTFNEVLLLTKKLKLFFLIHLFYAVFGGESF